jgi:hypothetical protein
MACRAVPSYGLEEGGFRSRTELAAAKRIDSRYRSGRSPDWIKSKNLTAPAVKREAEEDWGK